MSKIPVKVENNAVIQIGNNDNYLNITLHRTLRIPDDGKVYPLPPSLGVFPIHKVDDYKDTVPEEWLKAGGVFFPMYQREAMWLQFNLFCKEGTKPKALKVAVGKVNAINGKPWKKELVKGVDDYLCVPDQKWLDGINSGTGYIKQFVAMPLGEGYTVEGQVTGEEKFGGIQMIMYDSKNVRKPVSTTTTTTWHNPIIQKPKPRPIFNPPQPIYNPPQPFFPPPRNNPYPVVMGGLPVQYDNHAPRRRPVNFDQHNVVLKSAGARGGRMNVKRKKQSGFVGNSNNYGRNQSYTQPKFEMSFENEKIISDGAQEMGLASGGKMKQKIIKDKYGFENWDLSKYGSIHIRIVNSEMYYNITGEKPPESEITAKSYTSYGYPWFDFYEEKKLDIKPSKILSKIKTVKEIDEERGKKGMQNDETVKIGVVKEIKVEEEPVEQTPSDPKPDTSIEQKPQVEDNEDMKKKLKLLASMGFQDEKLNRFMLKKHGMNIQKVTALLVQFEEMK